MSEVRPVQPSATTRTFAPGTRLGRYRVARRLGVGGMAEVYLAVVEGPRGFEKRVALKVLHAHAANDADRIAELFREARVAATLEHPNIAQVLDVGSDRGEFFLAMEYVHGRDVRDVMAAVRPAAPLPLACAIQIVAEAARGLAYAHDRHAPDGRPLGLVHRDISPSNVLLSYDGAVKVADFGLAKVDTSSVDTQTGVLKGKFGYMSPEQTRGQRVDRRCDVYALGIMLYELSLGRRAFAGLNAFEIMNKVLVGDFAPPRAIDPEYPEALEAIVLEAMALAPDDRFSGADQLEQALRTFAADHDLRPSAAELATLMEARFGPAEEPTIVFAPERQESSSADEPTTIVPVESAARPAASTRPTLAVVAIGAAVTAGALGWWLGGGRTADAPPAAVSEPATVDVPAAVRGSSSGTPSGETSPVTVDLPPRDDAPEPSTPPTASPAEDDTASSRPQTRKRARNSGSRAERASKASGTRDAATRRSDRDLTSMFPPPLQ